MLGLLIGEIGDYTCDSTTSNNLQATIRRTSDQTLLSATGTMKTSSTCLVVELSASQPAPEPGVNWVKRMCGNPAGRRQDLSK